MPSRHFWGELRRQRTADITDGMGNTILLGEIRRRHRVRRPRRAGHWATAAASSAATAASGATTTAPTAIGRLPTIVELQSTSERRSAAAAAVRRRACPATEHPQRLSKPPAASTPSGVHVCMADGSGRWISDFVQSEPSQLINGNGAVAKEEDPYTPPYKPGPCRSGTA